MNPETLKADLAFVNGQVITMNPTLPLAQTVMTKAGKIMAVGNLEQTESLIGQETKVFDISGKTLLPGFIETHCHASVAGTTLAFEISLHSASSIAEVVQRLAEKLKSIPEGQWVIGRGYDDKKMKDHRTITKLDLDRASSSHPILISRFDYHMTFVNSLALQLAGITSASPDPEGGWIEKMENNKEPSGKLQELAQNMVIHILPGYTIQDTKLGIREACRTLSSLGITLFTDPIVDHDKFVAYQELQKEGNLSLRAGILFPWFPLHGRQGYARELKAIGLKSGFGNERLKILGTKFITDGSLSNHSALLSSPYEDQPGNFGQLLFPPDELMQGVEESFKAGLVPCIHAIGDKAVEFTLDMIENALKNQPKTDHRIRIDHCTLASPDAIERMKRLNVVLSSAVGYLLELGPVHMQAIGEERMRDYLPHKSYLEKGIISAGHSDWPVTPANILRQLSAAITRESNHGTVCRAEQGISLMDALMMYTINAAYVSGEEQIKGSIEVGKVADLIVLNSPLLEMEPHQIQNVEIEMTVVGGDVVYRVQ